MEIHKFFIAFQKLLLASLRGLLQLVLNFKWQLLGVLKIVDQVRFRVNQPSDVCLRNLIVFFIMLTKIEFHFAIFKSCVELLRLLPMSSHIRCLRPTRLRTLYQPIKQRGGQVHSGLSIQIFHCLLLFFESILCNFISNRSHLLTFNEVESFFIM